MMPSIFVLGLGRIYPDYVPCGLFLGCWVFAFVFGALGDISKALFVYFEFCAAEDLLKLFARESVGSDLTVSLISNDKSEKSVYDTVSFAIRAKLFVRAHLIKIAFGVSAAVMIAYTFLILVTAPNYAASSVSENQCWLGPSNVPIVVMCFVAMITAVMHVALKNRMSRVSDNFGLKNDFDDLSKPTFLISMLGVVGLIPTVAWYAYDNFLFYEMALQVASIIGSIVIVGKPAFSSFSKKYRIMDMEEFKSNRHMTMNVGLGLFDDYLTDPVKSLVLEQFLIRELNVENMIFVRSVKNFKAQASKSAQDRIVRLFIIEYSVSQVNLPHMIRENIIKKHNIGIAEPDIFDEAYDEIYNLLFRDAFMRFVQTDEFLASSRGKGGVSRKNSVTDAEALIPISVD